MEPPSLASFFRKCCLSLLLFAAVAGLAAPAEAAPKTGYVASNYSDRYHRPECKIAQKIRPDELLTFAAAEEAVAAGLVPCKKCNPPTSSVKDPRG